MKTITSQFLSGCATAALLILLSSVSARAHVHIDAGVSDDALHLFHIPHHPLEMEVVPENSGNYKTLGYIYEAAPTFTALDQSTDSDASFYDPDGAPSGSFLELQLVSLDGPVGGSLVFVERAEVNPSRDPTFTLHFGDINQTGSFALTEQIWFEADPSNPFGHFHGRLFAVNLPGTYVLGVRVLDTQGDYMGNPSDVFHISFVAIPEPVTGGLALVGFALAMIAGRKLRERRRFGH